MRYAQSAGALVVGLSIAVLAVTPLEGRGDAASTLATHLRTADDQRDPGGRLRAGSQARSDKREPPLYECPRLAFLDTSWIWHSTTPVRPSSGSWPGLPGREDQPLCRRRRHGARRRHGRQPLLQRPDARELQHGPLAGLRRDICLQQHGSPRRGCRPPVVRGRREPDDRHRPRQRRGPQHLSRQRRDRSRIALLPGLGSRQQHAGHVPLADSGRRGKRGHPLRAGQQGHTCR